METNWAAEHLQVIRTLMERSAIYRRALAPIMTINGVVGIAGSVIGWLFNINSLRGFVLFWCAVACIALTGSFLQVRRQALKDREPFWSPPTRRIAQALLPALFIGAFAGFVSCLFASADYIKPWGGLPVLWMLLYGCALNAAGFFMHRGIKFLGWIIVVCGCGFMAIRYACASEQDTLADHRAMGLVFGAVQLAYGIYLYFTEKRRNET